MISHKPVLINECIQALNIFPDGVYVDVTFGGGGHSHEILKKLNRGMLYAFDRDHDVRDDLMNHQNFKLIRTNYKNMKRFLRLEGVNQVDGILADLGVSSHQMDVPERGFSFRFESRLDMRMNRKEKVRANDILNNYSSKELAKVFYNYGELKNSRKIASKIVKRRKIKEFITTTDLLESIQEMVPRRKEKQFLSRVFQSLRIEVNNEMESLNKMMIDGISILRSKGRFVVLSYHSLEDRMVKNIFKSGNQDGEIQKDFYGNIINKMRLVNKKIIIPTREEVEDNSRSRSAKLRIAEKV